MNAGFHHILVPLDGTESSELSLQAAQKALAEQGKLTLLRVVDLLGDHYLPDDADKDKMRDQQIHPAVVYLEEVQSRIKRSDLQLDTTVASGAVADAILSVAKDKEADAIAMCTHTEAKVRQFLMGSVAQRVVRNSDVPVILVHPKE